MGDSNWLLSSAAQSAAALVAIVGGFLVSRLVSLAVERKGLAHQLEDAQRQLVSVRKHAEFASRRLLEQDAFDFLDRARSELASGTQFPLAAHLSHRPLDELQPFWVWASTVASAARSGDSYPARSPFVIMGTAWLEERIRQAATKAPSRGILGGLDLDDLQPADVRAINTLDENIAYRQLVSEGERTAADLRRQEADSRVLRARLEALSEVPPEVQNGLYVLVFFGLAGVAVPLAVLAAEPKHVSTLWRWVIWSLFATGMIVLWVYVADLIARMTQRGMASDLEIAEPGKKPT